MVNKKPSLAATNRKSAVFQEFLSGASHTLLTKRKWSDYNGLENEVNNMGVDESHWDKKYNQPPYTKDKGWINYLMDADVEGNDADEATAQKKADDEVDARIGSVLYVWAKAAIEFYHYQATNLTDNAKKREVGDDLKEYMNIHQSADEQAVYGEDDIKKLIKTIEDEAKKGGTTPSPKPKPTPIPTPTTPGGEDFENCGMGQRYYGDADLESVGFCMRYLKTS